MRVRRLLAVLALLVPASLPAHVIPLTPREQVETADYVVVAVVEDFLADGEGDLRALADATQEGFQQAREEFTLGNLAIPPLIFAPLPASSPFSPHDQEQMAYWNLYQPDLFRVGAPAVTWSFGNGISEIAGFPDSGKLQAEMGQAWFDGAVSIIAWRLENGRVVEVDIALNPSQRWTLDEAEATRPGGPFSFRRVLLANLGTAWGMRTSFNLSPKRRESVVNLSLDPYNAATLFSDDTAAVREAFGGTPIRDGLISSYSIVPFPLAPRRIPIRLSPASVRPGGGFKVVNPIKIENTGTESFANPRVEVYLVPRRFSLEGAVKVKQLRVRATIAPGDIRNVDVGRIAAPASLPPGVYFLAFRLRAAGDEYPGNDTAWSAQNVSLTVKAD